MLKYALLLCVLLGVGAGAPAFSHARLLRSSPAAAAAVTPAPTALVLTFSEKAQLAVLRLTASSADIPISLDRTAPAATTVTVKLPPLLPGTYAVQWTALAVDDGHITKGSFTFRVLPPVP